MGNAESTEATNAGHLEEEVERDDVDENNVEDAGELKEELALEQEEEQPGQEANIPTEAVVNDQRQTDAEEVEDLAKTGYHVLKVRADRYML